jgi:hypothetical protein
LWKITRYSPPSFCPSDVLTFPIADNGEQTGDGVIGAPSRGTRQIALRTSS